MSQQDLVLKPWGLIKMFCNIFHKSEKFLCRLMRGTTGQALIELSVFGMFIILLLGVLISYGLKYNFQQQASMEAMRRSQEVAQQVVGGLTRGSSSVTLVKDKHIPDPSNPFGVGSVMPIIASASVTRDHRLDATPDNYEDLPKMIMRFEGNDGVVEEKKFATAGIRQDIITGDNMTAIIFPTIKKKYQYVYGSVDFEPEDMNFFSPEDVTASIIDSVEGEIVDYSTAKQQARMLVDQDYFIAQCLRRAKPGEEGECGLIASMAIPMPWYVQGCYHNNVQYSFPPNNKFAGLNQPGDTWDFPRIEALFINPHKPINTERNVQSLGMQPETIQTTERELSLEKDENNVTSTTKDSLYWSTVTSRTLLSHDHLNPGTGIATSPAGNPTIKSEEVNTTRSDDIEFTWSTEW